MSKIDFLRQLFGQMVNRGLDIGIRVVFPDFLENSIIEVKDAFIQEGLGSAVRTAIDQTMELGRQALDFVRRGFSSTPDAISVLDRGDVTGNISKTIDEAITKMGNNNEINPEIRNGLLARESYYFRKY